MATVNFRLRKVKSDQYPILVYLSMGRNNIIQVKTDFVIKPNDWSSATKRPKQNNESNKKLFKDLKTLDSYIFNQLNESLRTGDVINRYWLESIIRNCFDRTEKKEQDNNLLTVQTQYLIDNAKSRKINGGDKIGLSENTIKGYNTFLKIVKDYQAHINKEIRLTDINSLFFDGFVNWLIGTDDKSRNYSKNHAGKQIALLKTVCRDAIKRDVRVHPFTAQIKSFSESKENKYLVTLSFDEIEKIRVKELTKDYLINTRKWLLLGCEIGQRGGDVLSLTSNNLRQSNEVLYIDLCQEKTGKDVTIPIAKEYIRSFLLNDFPHKITSQRFNEYLKELCKVCDIDEQTQGKKFDPKTGRKKLGYYPKHELISSHVLRRSFASNYYKHIPTPVLMEITAHSKEVTFLEYIGKPKDKDQNANLFLKLVQDLSINKESNLK